MARLILLCESDDFTISIPAAPAVNYRYTTIPMIFTDPFFRNLALNIQQFSKNAKSLIYRYKVEIQNFQGARIAKVDSANVFTFFRLFAVKYGPWAPQVGTFLLTMPDVSEWQESNQIINATLFDEDYALTIDPFDLLIDLRNADTAFDGITIAKLVITLDIEVN